jgi:uncharacterized membrane protein YagU involved in acid resistance
MQWSFRSAVLVGGLIAGALDILFAITFAYVEGGVPPMSLLQTVASGVLGKASYEGGAGAAALGLALHFLISLLFAAAYVLASRRIEVLTKHPVIAGAVFGIGVFLVMRLVVLPLSAFPHPVRFRPLASVLDLLSHMFLFGVPIALAALKASVAQQRPSASG